MIIEKKALLSTIPSDAHNWNIVFIEFFLIENGFEVTNLGPCTPEQEVLTKIDEEDYDLVVVSTVNGHGFIEGAELARKIRKHAAYDLDLVIGGKLAVRNDHATLLKNEAKLLKAGFDAVFDDKSGNTFDAFQAFLTSRAWAPGCQSGHFASPQLAAG